MSRSNDNQRPATMYLPDQRLQHAVARRPGNTSMKILVINYEFPPLGGGAGRGTYNLARELAVRGHQVEVLTSRAEGYQKTELVEGFRVHRVKSYRKGIHDCGFRGAFSFLLFAIPVFLRLTRSTDYDIIHYYFSLPTGLLRFLPGKHRQVPYIVSLRGSDVPNYDTYNKSLQVAHSVLLPITRTIWRDAARVVALSSDLANSAKLADPKIRIDIVPNGIESEMFVYEPQLRDARSDSRVQFICVTRLIERKGVQHLLKAMTELDDSVFLTIVGEGNYMSELQALSKELKLDSKVKFYGYCPREKLVRLYNASDVFVLPSMAESFGMVFVEAMSCGLPVIGAHVGGVPDIIKEDNGILVQPGSVSDIVNAARELATNAEMRQKMGEANRKKAVAQYAWRSVAEAYEAIYQECTGTIEAQNADQVI